MAAQIYYIIPSGYYFNHFAFSLLYCHLVRTHSAKTARTVLILCCVSCQLSKTNYKTDLTVSLTVFTCSK